MGAAGGAVPARLAGGFLLSSHSVYVLEEERLGFPLGAQGKCRGCV